MSRHAIAFVLLLAAGSAHAAPWVYRGALSEAGQPSAGLHDLRLTLIDALGAIEATQVLTDVSVVDGRFAVDVDFGIDLARQPPLRLVTEVRRGKAAFAPVGTPTWIDAAAVAGTACWGLLGNAGTVPANNFLGTLDAQPLEVRVDDTRALRIAPSAEQFGGLPITVNWVAGSVANALEGAPRGVTIRGGGAVPGTTDPSFTFSDRNVARTPYATIGGGAGNLAGNLNVPPEHGLATLGGGLVNFASDRAATVAGGFGNLATRDGGAIGGGILNRVDAVMAAVRGGAQNNAAGDRSTIGGGITNEATAHSVVVLGGRQGAAASPHSAMGGGSQNIVSAENAVVDGGLANCAGGVASWAGGENAQVRPAATASVACPGASTSVDGDKGSFVWGGRVVGLVSTTDANQFIVRAHGGVYLGTDSAPAVPADRYINTSTGAFLSSGGTWTNASSRALKTDFEVIDPLAVLGRVLALPVLQWRYRAAPDEGTHLGPIAEDFHAAFGLGAEPGAISTVDAAGVALAAIQGLHQRHAADQGALAQRLDALAARLGAGDGGLAP